jgi:raffinose synthase
MSRKHYFSLLLLLLINSLCAQQIPVELKISESSKTIDIVSDGVKRISGGAPLVQANELPDTKVGKREKSYSFTSSGKKIEVSIKKGKHQNVVGLYIHPTGFSNAAGKDFTGFFFQKIDNYKEGVAFYRYKPWNSWTKPIKIGKPSELKDWDNQFFYWQYNDGTYGAAVPLYGNGYRVTIGAEKGKFGSKAVSYKNNYKSDTIPSMALGFGKDPYLLFEQLFESAMEFSGMGENLRKKKTFPEPFNYLGWCTWNASDMGQNLNEKTILKGIESFSNHDFQLGWLLIDDGWFSHRNSQLRSLKPDSLKFPQGFSPLVNKLKKDYHLKHVGIWHALNGYWNGIDPESPLGKQYKQELFSWKQRERVEVESSPVVTYHFLKPNSDSLIRLFDKWHSYLKSEGFSFLKVDNQLAVERMSVDNYPIGDLATSMHNAVNTSAKKYFDNAMINCMDMTADAFYNFGETPVARSVEDYFPYEEGENYNLQRGNAAAHILQGIYNNLYFGQMIFPDLDMFQSHNPNGEFHAIARAINNGPIYITDKVGEQNFNILKKLVYKDGRIIRSEHPLVPTKDCLFQVQDKKPFKAYSQSNGIGLLGIWNCADADLVTGDFSASDFEGVKGEKFALYENLSGEVKIIDQTTKMNVSLKRMGYKLYFLAPLKNGIAPIGLLDKYNSPATIQEFAVKKGELRVKLYGEGVFAAVVPSNPVNVKVNGKELKDFKFEKGLLKVNVPAGSDKPEIVIIL